jgi:exonuclease III
MMLRLCHINITSIKKYKDELLARFSNQDIISVNETNLEKDTPFYLKGYNIYRNDRVGKSGGGVLLAVKENIKSREIFNQTIDNNEIVAIEVETKSFGNILIASMYVPPTSNINPEVFRDLHQINNDCIVMGDLNAALEEMGSRKTNKRGKQLEDIINEGYLIGIDDDSTTFERNNYEEKLDWILASQPLFAFITDFEVQPSLGLSSGHKPIVFNLSQLKQN